MKKIIEWLFPGIVEQIKEQARKQLYSDIINGEFDEVIIALEEENDITAWKLKATLRAIKVE